MALVDDYEDAVRRNLPTKDYLAQMIAASAGLPIQGVTAATPNMLPSGVKPTGGSILSGLKGGIDSITNALMGGILGDVGTPAPAAIKDVTDALDSGKSALGFITDIPRVATTLLGLIILIAGIFALAKGPAVSVTQAVRNAVP